MGDLTAMQVTMDVLLVFELVHTSSEGVTSDCAFAFLTMASVTFKTYTPE